LYCSFFIQLAFVFASTFKFIGFASTAGPESFRDNRNAAAFGSLKKFASHFFNPHFVRTKPKEAANPVTGGN
jgi:hypothetical protein